MFGGIDPAKRHSSVEKENAAGAGSSGYGGVEKRSKLNDNRTLKRNSTEPEDQRYGSKEGGGGSGSGGNKGPPLSMFSGGYANNNIMSQMSNLSL